MSPQNSRVEVPIPRTSACDSIWKQGLYRDDQGTVVSSGWSLASPIGKALMGRGHLNTGARGRGSMGTWRPCPQAKCRGLSRRQAGPRAQAVAPRLWGEPFLSCKPVCVALLQLREMRSVVKSERTPGSGHKSDLGKSTQKNRKHNNLKPAGGADPVPTSCLAVRLAFTSPASPESLGPGTALPHPAQAGSHRASFCLRPARGAAGGFQGPHCPAAPGLGAPKTCLTLGRPSCPGNRSLSHAPTQSPQWRKLLETAREGASAGKHPPA